MTTGHQQMPSLVTGPERLGVVMDAFVHDHSEFVPTQARRALASELVPKTDQFGTSRWLLSGSRTTIVWFRVPASDPERSPRHVSSDGR